MTDSAIAEAVRAICARFGEDYWRELDARRAYPSQFVAALTAAGYLAALIPEEYGGAGLGMCEAATILEEISRSGAHAGACHAQMYVMGSLLRHGSREQKQQWLPQIANGSLRLQSFAVTEPDAGTDTASISAFARKDGDRYVVSGKKVWISRVAHSDLMILLVRTTPREQTEKKTGGLSVLLVDLRDAIGNGLTVTPIDAMINHHACELFFDDLKVPAENLIGEQDKGFRVIMDGMNAERILIAAECIGDARYFIDKSAAYARERRIFGRPIGQNQGIQLPLARAYAETELAALMVREAATLFDRGEPCGEQANIAKLAASEISFRAGDLAMEIHGGYAFAREYNIERKWRETRLYRTAPISTNLILAHIGEHVLGLPRSF